jgi:hypothetical protein
MPVPSGLLPYSPEFGHKKTRSGKNAKTGPHANSLMNQVTFSVPVVFVAGITQ